MKGKRLFQNKLIVLGVIALLIVGLVLPFPNFKDKVQVNAARERITSEVTDWIDVNKVDTKRVNT